MRPSKVYSILEQTAGFHKCVFSNCSNNEMGMGGGGGGSVFFLLETSNFPKLLGCRDNKINSNVSISRALT